VLYDITFCYINRNMELAILIASDCLLQHEMQPQPLLVFLADRTNGHAIATLLRLSSVCDVMYCG